MNKSSTNNSLTYMLNKQINGQQGLFECFCLMVFGCFKFVFGWKDWTIKKKITLLKILISTKENIL
jgi:hypothetical protein